ncbi:ATP-binding cassette domain-containing protein (plasmid) [Pontibacillus sp. ALD_SL1]|uniref:cell division ATP-binding protein FtsE n=1 Tax=Pontibacillus sp. ALD_SL1 TaxID=2777185 RepID=UPI001A96FF7D|nr:ATP-binding cassette domain-containing protein [Pontibacillus sp. ALD_SL1]QST03074.1 ATP-binding cassette domain-containing protein [Pontibacillus sp. ALD_SL1]
MIEYQAVQKIYNRKIPIKSASFSVSKGEFVLLAGPSGAGKSTLLKMLYKEEKPNSGNIIVYNRNIRKIRTKKLRRMLGVVFQDFEATLLKNKTAYENVAYVLESLGMSPFRIRKQTEEALDRLGILDKAKQYPSELSGGEKQRVAIARAIVNKPEIILCDEPTGNLDAENEKIVMHYLNELNQEGATILMTTHNVNILNEERKRILWVSDGKVSDYIVEDVKNKKIDITSLLQKSVMGSGQEGTQ